MQTSSGGAIRSKSCTASPVAALEVEKAHKAMEDAEAARFMKCKRSGKLVEQVERLIEIDQSWKQIM